MLFLLCVCVKTSERWWLFIGGTSRLASSMLQHFALPFWSIILFYYLPSRISKNITICILILQNNYLMETNFELWQVWYIFSSTFFFLFFWMRVFFLFSEARLAEGWIWYYIEKFYFDIFWYFNIILSYMDSYNWQI